MEIAQASSENEKFPLDDRKYLFQSGLLLFEYCWTHQNTCWNPDES
jgi:hypothetical protein